MSETVAGCKYEFIAKKNNLSLQIHSAILIEQSSNNFNEEIEINLLL